MTLLVDERRRPVLEARGHVLVTGGPGSGKTTLAIEKAKARIDAGLQPAQSVLFLSFSRAAVARIIEASKSEISKEVHRRFTVQTLHSFFWEILRAHGYLLGAPRRLRLLLPHDVKAMRSGVDDEDAEWLATRERLFHEEGRVVFDLFAPKAHALLAGSRKIRGLVADRHPLIIVDEAQDTAEDQWVSVKLLAELTQLVCLADLEQQIYEFRPGVSSERVRHIMVALNPLCVDLDVENHRSRNLEIVAFGNDILRITPRGRQYKGVSRMKFRPNADKRDKRIRESVGILNRRIKAHTGRQAENVAILSTRKKGVEIISRALTGNGGVAPIPHFVFVDEAGVLLASRLIAFLLEPKEPSRDLAYLAEGLELVAAAFRAKGGKTHLTRAQKSQECAEQARGGKLPRRLKTAGELLNVLKRLAGQPFTGDPRVDWLQARKHLEDSASSDLRELAADAGQLRAFNRGQRIAEGLIEAWQTRGAYVRARSVLDAALAQEQLLDGAVHTRGINVMTIHKSKGKEFDGVIIIDDANNSPLIFNGESAPYPRCRRLLRVGITRACHHVLLLTDLFKPSELLKGHKL